LAAFDFWDELDRLSRAYEGNDRQCLIQLGELLLKALEESGCERLNSDSWQTDIQRAIRIDTTLPPAANRKLRKKSPRASVSGVASSASRKCTFSNPTQQQ